MLDKKSENLGVQYQRQYDLLKGVIEADKKKYSNLSKDNLSDKKIIERSNKYASLDKAFCFHKVMFYANKCCNGVKWEKSTTNFRLHKFTIISNTCYNIKNNKYKVGKTYKFKINERGKIRNKCFIERYMDDSIYSK